MKQTKNNSENEKIMCELEPSKECDNCGACMICDLDPKKICDNCGMCLDLYNTDEKGFVSIKIDKILPSDEVSLEELYKQYGLDGEDN